MWTAALEEERPADLAPLSTAEQGSVGIALLLLPKNTEKNFIFEYVM